MWQQLLQQPLLQLLFFAEENKQRRLQKHAKQAGNIQQQETDLVIADFVIYEKGIQKEGKELTDQACQHLVHTCSDLKV